MINCLSFVQGRFGRKTLWECLVECLKTQHAVRWTNKEIGRFKVIDPVMFFHRWNENGGNTKYVDYIWRAFRTYTKETNGAVPKLMKIHEGRKSMNEWQITPCVFNCYRAYFGIQ